MAAHNLFQRLTLVISVPILHVCSDMDHEWRLNAGRTRNSRMLSRLHRKSDKLFHNLSKMHADKSFFFFFYLSCYLLLYCVVKWLKGYQLCCFTLKYSTDCHCPVSFNLLLNQKELKWSRFVRFLFELLTPSVTSENKGTAPPGYTYNVILSHWKTLSEENHLPDWDTKQLEKVTLKTGCKFQGTLHICADLSPDKLVLF